MSTDFSWDALEGIGQTEEAVAPFFTVKNKEEKEIHKWLNDEFAYLKLRSNNRFERIRQNLRAYKAEPEHRRLNRSNSSRLSAGVSIDKASRLAVNHLYDITETKISTMTRLKPAVEIIPTNDEINDKNASVMAGLLIKHLWYINNVDMLMQNVHRNKYLGGEAFLFVEWNEDKGDLHPLYVEAKNEGVELEYVDADGNTITDENGETVKISGPIRTGDVDYCLEFPWRVFLQSKDRFEDVDYIFRVKVMHIDEVKAKYPNKADKIEIKNNLEVFDPHLLGNRRLKNEAIVITMYHRRTKLVPEGREITFTHDCILSDSPSKYSHDRLPMIRITDIDFPGSLHGISFYEQVKSMQAQHNNLSTMIIRNQFLASHPKWMMPRGAAKIESLANDVTVVQFQGPIAPQLVQSNPTPREIFDFRNQVKEEMEQISAVHGVSRGVPPQGITANVALRFLNEQENERNSSEIAKHLSFVRELAILSLSVAGDYYDESDGRTLRILGKNKEHLIENLDLAALHRPYDIRVDSSSSLPESKSARVSTIIELMQYKPDLLASERWIELLDLGADKKAISLITVAVDAAEKENDLASKGKQIEDPEEWEDHIVHWRTHVKFLQSPTFKKLDDDTKDILIEHIKITEFLMYNKMLENPTFEMKLAALDLYPIFYKIPVKPRSREQQMLEVQGATNQGIPTNTMVGGQPIPENTNE
jgi:hypothetical protein